MGKELAVAQVTPLPEKSWVVTLHNREAYGAEITLDGSMFKTSPITRQKIDVEHSYGEPGAALTPNDYLTLNVSLKGSSRQSRVLLSDLIDKPFQGQLYLAVWPDKVEVSVHEYSGGRTLSATTGRAMRKTTLIARKVFQLSPI